MTLLSRVCWLSLCLFAGFSGFAEAETIEFRGARFFVYRFDPKVEKLELFLPGQGPNRSPTFQQLEKDLNAKGRRLKVAMNAGIYEPGFRPSGLTISEGKTLVPLNTSGPPPKTSPNDFTPNFYLLPNGVFFIRPDGTAAVRSTDFYAKANESPRLATQSGPLALASGKIHPAFNENSQSRLIRNGVGVDSKGRVVLVASDRTPDVGRINLWGFAALFRDKLDCRNALYLDGDISRLYIRGETDTEVPRSNFFAGILAITEPLK
ncbi:MAG: phosphodiester glycosidase family protein [Verrucomicrobiae bacterium]|nr:phosphodiester glycosidase family protein [Verrucomicrobiae bacterium]